MEIKQAFEIIDLIQNTPSTNDKIEIIKEHKDNTIFTDSLIMALDGNYIFNIKDIPVPDRNTSEITLGEAIEFLPMLYNRVVTGNAARESIKTVLEGLSIDDARLFHKILQKDLKCGIGTSLVNKAIPSLISETPYMRCSLFNEKTIQKIDFTNGAYSELKMNGQYGNHIITDVYECRSRDNKQYDFLGELDQEMFTLRKWFEDNDSRFSKGAVLNGEILVAEDDEFTKPLDRKTGNGIIQKFGKDTGSIDEARKIYVTVWDVLPYDKFNKKGWDAPRHERIELIERAIKECKLKRIKMVEYKVVYSVEEALKHYQGMLSRNEEGTVLKDRKAVWKSHTSPLQLKMKLEIDVDLICVGFNPGKKGTKFENTLGTIECVSACGKLRVNVSGFKEKGKGINTRDYIWNHKEEFLNKVVEVTCNEVSNNKNGEFSLGLPRFSEWRFDKNTADTLERCFEIQEMAMQLRKK